MKKKFLIFLFVLSCVVLTNFVYAYQIEDYLKIDNIDDLENAYLVNHGAKSRIELSPEENKELSLLIQSHKDHAYGVTPVAEAIRLDDYTGGIFIHYDSSFSSWIHGHAAIGYGIGTIEIMNYKETVKQYFGGRINEWYGHKTGGFFTMQGADKADNKAAADNAVAKYGTGYWIISEDSFGGYTCSGLVAVSWEEAGFGLGGRTASPRIIEKNSKTRLMFLWPGE